MDQPSSGIIKRIALSLIILLTLLGCRLVSYLNPASPTPTPTQTPTPENCFWNWAYGEGSTEFDDTITQKLASDNIQAVVKSSSYGEIYSCDQTFHPKDLDIKVEIKVDNLADQELLTKTSELVFTLLRNNLSISNINNLGNVNLTFITPDGNNCFWNAAQNQCAE
ncbi:MAG: hypothetical protein C0410_06385 [Anaerolinea sp.]|nr:hypothetical protein [Anaerolinea sp.]